MKTPATAAPQSPIHLEGVTISPVFLEKINTLQNEECSLVTFYRDSINEIMDYLITNEIDIENTENPRLILSILRNLRCIDDIIESFNPNYERKGLPL